MWVINKAKKICVSNIGWHDLVCDNVDNVVTVNAKPLVLCYFISCTKHSVEFLII